MSLSKNEQVQKFLDDTRDSENEKYQILQQCRKITFSLNNDITERIIYGGIMFTKEDEDFGGIFVNKKHVSFEFTNGFQLADKNALLEGKGKYRRHLKLKTISDIEEKQVKYFVKQVAI